MRNTIGMLITATLLVVGIPQTASAGSGCLFCFGLGYVIGNSGAEQTPPRSGADVLYEMPRAAERVRDPLQAYVAGETGSASRLNGKTLGQRFRLLFAAIQRDEYVPRPDWHSGDFEILQIVRIPAESGTYPELWFIYTEKANVKPLADLPPPKPAN